VRESSDDAACLRRPPLVLDTRIGQAGWRETFWIEQQDFTQEVLGRDVLDPRMSAQAIPLARRKVA
jgi:hypothetical protein